MGLGKTVALENEFFSRPEGRSMNCYIPMPFRKSARIVLTNKSEAPTSLCYTIFFSKVPSLPDDINYFHCAWRRKRRTQLGKDCEILRMVKGKGRFIGTNISVIANPEYEQTWFGEGEAKIYLDGYTDYPTLCGTGTEDYIGSGWGQVISLSIFCRQDQKVKINIPIYIILVFFIS